MPWTDADLQAMALLAEHDQRVADCGTVICPRCKREAHGWPLKRADVCSPADWVYCIRQPWNIQAG